LRCDKCGIIVDGGRSAEQTQKGIPLLLSFFFYKSIKGVLSAHISKKI
jgi:hypothetical protein